MFCVLVPHLPALSLSLPFSPPPTTPNPRTHAVNHGLVDGAAKDARVQVLLGALHRQVKVSNAAKAVGDAGLGRAQPVVVGDAEAVDVLEEAAQRRNGRR